jgi:hypothetical protein
MDQIVHIKQANDTPLMVGTKEKQLLLDGALRRYKINSNRKIFIEQEYIFQLGKF